MKNGRGEEASVPEIRENCVEAVATVAETRAADQPGVLIQEWESACEQHTSPVTFFRASQHTFRCHIDIGSSLCVAHFISSHPLAIMV